MTVYKAVLGKNLIRPEDVASPKDLTPRQRTVLVSMWTCDTTTTEILGVQEAVLHRLAPLLLVTQHGDGRWSLTRRGRDFAGQLIDEAG